MQRNDQDKKDKNIIEKAASKFKHVTKNISTKKSKKDKKQQTEQIEQKNEINNHPEMQTTDLEDNIDMTPTSSDDEWTIDDSNTTPIQISSALSEKIQDTMRQFNIPPTQSAFPQSTTPQVTQATTCTTTQPPQPTKSVKSLPPIPTKPTTSLPPQDMPPLCPIQITPVITEEPTSQVTIEPKTKLEHQISNPEKETPPNLTLASSSFLDELNAKRRQLKKTNITQQVEKNGFFPEKTNEAIIKLPPEKKAKSTPLTTNLKKMINLDTDDGSQPNTNKVATAVTEEFVTIKLTDYTINSKVDELKANNTIPNNISQTTNSSAEEAKISKNKSSLFCCCGTNDSSEDETSKLISNNTTIQRI